MPFIGRRYQLIDKLGAGGMGIVYRALDRLTGQQVALKQVTTAVDSLRFGSQIEKSIDVRLALTQEFQTLSSLRHPNIISVLDYGFDDGRQPYYTMDLLRDSRTIVQASSGQPLDVKVDFLVQLLQALVYLHRRGVIHRDLKPDNVYVIAGRVKVLDFGLALMRGDSPQRGDSLTGTLAYMAPELLNSKAASKASDLYAVGMMAYEILAGKHPFRLQNVAQLLEDIQFSIPDTALLEANAETKAVINQLLAKDPADRIQEAADVIRLYAETTGQRARYESQAIRESFLQAAQFVGRDAEQQLLSGAVTEAVQGNGQGWLIGGESGVGKSRLVEQLRVLALVQGALVLRGQAITSGPAYHLWREPLRWLALDDSLSPLEAGVLKQIIPDIIVIRGEEVDDAPVIESQANQARLLTTVETILKRQVQPVVVIIEDLHWADNESLSVLMHLVRLCSSMPMLVVGSFRDDERPDLPSLLEGMRLLKLSRLSDAGIAELSTAMLGAAGRNQQLITFLSHETEGNAFFLVETVRALAEEAGELDKIARMSLPQSIAAGGVQRVVKRRLSHVPVAARPQLELAAVIGRELDLSVLQAAEPTVDLTNWLNLCSDAAVLDVNDERWRFAHDKLREGTLDSLSVERRQLLHRQAALALEQVYPGRIDQAVRLAFHWANADDIEKERHYSAVAGEQALNSGAQQEAIRLLRRALELGIADSLHHSHLERCLSAAYYELGDMAASHIHALATLQALAQPFPSSRSATSLATLTQLGQQVRYWLRPAKIHGTAAAGRAVLLEKSRAYERLAVANYMMSNSSAAVYSTLSALNLSERIGPSPELARNCVNTGMGLGLIRLHRPARYYLRRARQIAENSPATMRWVMTVTGAYYTGLGQWPDAYNAFRQAETIARDIGDVDGIEDGLIGQTCIHYGRDEFEACLTTGWALYTSALRGDLQGQATGLSYCQAIWLQQGNHAKIKEQLEPFAQIVANSTDAGMRINGYGMLSLVYLEQGEKKLAVQAAQTALELVSAVPPTSYLTVLGYATLVQTLLSFWASGDESQAANARQACKVLAKFARLFPYANPALYRAQGLIAWLDGQPTQAVTLWQKGLAEARRLEMPYKAALIHYEIGYHLSQSDPAHRSHLEHAKIVFERMGAETDLALVRIALN